MTTTLNGVLYPESNTPLIGGATQGAMQAYQYRIAPALGAAAAIRAAITLTAAPQTITAGIVHPDFPRVLAITGGALLQAGDVVINGKDAAGGAIQDTIALNGTAQVSGVKAFASVTSIVVPARVNVGDTVTIDTLDIFGLPNVLYNAADLIVKLFDGSIDAGTLAASATLSQNLYTPAGTPNGAKILALRYLV